jgi:hypothetical protein
LFPIIPSENPSSIKRKKNLRIVAVSKHSPLQNGKARNGPSKEPFDYWLNFTKKQQLKIRK